MVDFFLTTYKDDTNTHIYYFPGRDDSGHAITKMSFLGTLGDYRYTRHSDGAIDYIIIDGPSEIKCRVQYIQTREYKDITLKLR